MICNSLTTAILKCICSWILLCPSIFNNSARKIDAPRTSEWNFVNGCKTPFHPPPTLMLPTDCRPSACHVMVYASVFPPLRVIYITFCIAPASSSKKWRKVTPYSRRKERKGGQREKKNYHYWLKKLVPREKKNKWANTLDARSLAHKEEAWLPTIIKMAHNEWRATSWHMHKALPFAKSPWSKVRVNTHPHAHTLCRWTNTQKQQLWNPRTVITPPQLLGLFISSCEKCR